jgi:ssDNA-binding Zn-finger/Zn-ribbon topoisomerase 1
MTNDRPCENCGSAMHLITERKGVYLYACACGTIRAYIPGGHTESQLEEMQQLIDDVLYILNKRVRNDES